MLERWTLQADPAVKDPLRHGLWLKGEEEDVLRLVREFSPLCGRPRRHGAPFSHFLFLKGLTPNKLKLVRQFLAGLSVNGMDSEIPAASQQRSEAAPPPLAEPEGAVSPAVEPPTPQPDAVAETAPTPEAGPSASPEEPSRPGVEPAVETAGHVPTDSEGGPLPNDSSMRHSLAGELGHTSSPEGSVGRVPTDSGGDTSSPEDSVGHVRWKLLAAPSPQWTFDNLVVGAHNRFAHAAAMSVLGNVGGMYNPLLLFGLPGTGKSHLLNAIGAKLADAVGAEAVGLTSGFQLSRMASRAARSKDPSLLSGPLETLRVLLVDDVHLLNVGEDNKAALVKTLSSFTRGGKQLLLTSVYPPKALAGLEAGLGFQFGGGWSVELKPPQPQARRTCRHGLLQALSLPLPEPVEEALGEKTLGGLHETLKQALRLKTLLALAPGRAPGEMLDALVLPAEFQAPLEEELGLAQAFRWPTGDSSLGELGLFCPRGGERLGRYLLSQVHEAGQAAGFAPGFKEGPGQGYDPNQLYGVPFAIADFCEAKGLAAALILGPDPGTGLSQREAEFLHAMEHILAAIQVRLGWVSAAHVKCPPALLRAALDLRLGAP